MLKSADSDREKTSILSFGETGTIYDATNSHVTIPLFNKLLSVIVDAS